MKNYIIFGAGYAGYRAYVFLGEERVCCFADSTRYGFEYCNKEVISFEEMEDRYFADKWHIVIVVASLSHNEEMEQQMKDAGITKYVVFSEREVISRMPQYVFQRRNIIPTLTHLLLKYKISKYRRIAIYGSNILASFLALEIEELNPRAEVCLTSEIEERSSLIMDFVSLKKALVWADCLILNVMRQEDSIREKDVAGVDVVDIYDFAMHAPEFSYPELKKFHNLYKERRCFVIGTGPSLTVDDLEKLYRHRELCISCNKIYRIYDKTKWRADYIGFTDYRPIRDCAKDLSHIPGTVFVADDVIHSGMVSYLSGVTYFHHVGEEFFPYYPGFSDDFSVGAYGGMSVVYDFGLQFAAYLGCENIYLLGVDHDFEKTVSEAGAHFIDDYITEEEKKNYIKERTEPEQIERAYQKAEKYSRTHGFRIYNATRGGKLEVFERVAFDSLFEDEI